MNLLIKFPTRGRPDKFKYALFQYVSKCKDHQHTKFLFTFDHDDPTANADDFDEDYHEICGDIEYDAPYGYSKNKIDAVNRDMDDYPLNYNWDILLLASDDMIPCVKHYDQIIRDKMAEFYPDLDGVLWFNDGYAGDKLNTLVCMGRKYYERFGFIYHPAYKSFFCDNEFMDQANALKKQTYFPLCIIRHQHPNNTKDALDDELYRQNNKHWKEDERTYYHRKVYDYDLSVLICSLTERADALATLLSKIEECKKRSTLRVEVLTSIDNREKTIGTKRQDLITQANGKYCCFIDDDDDIDEDYFKEIQEVLNATPQADCVSMTGMFYKNGRKIKPFYHSIRYKRYDEDFEGFYRFPNHLNPILTGFCRRVGFVSKNHGEDTEFAKKLNELRLITSEACVRKCLYHYYFTEGKPTQTQKQTRPAQSTGTQGSSPTDT
jgi:hypothetical protein